MTVIRSPIRPVIFSPIRTATTRYKGGGFDWYPNRLFQSGDILLWYDPSDLTTMFTDTAGTQPVTADGDSVALMLDKGQWGGKSLTQVLAAQPELSTGGNLGAWSDTATATHTDTSITVSATGGVTLGPYDPGYYEVVIGGSAGADFSVNSADAALPTARTEFRTGAGNCIVQLTASRPYFYLRIGSASTIAVPSVSVKEIPGYHRVQATGTSMPKYKTDGALHWLLYDGTDDSNATGTITWGTDEIAICAGVTKSSDAAAGVFAELSTNAGAQAGAFGLYAPGTVAANYFFRSRGSSTSDNVRTSFASPITNVVTGMAEIAADTNILRIDDTEETVATDQGTGNYGSHVLYFGRRNNASVPFNGREYQTVIRSRLLSVAELASLETFVAAKTGVIL